jgi:hypothetical protein
VIVGSAGCRTCAAREISGIDFDHPTRDTDADFADSPAGNAKRNEDFDYDEFILREFQERSRKSRAPVVIAIALALFFVVIFLILAAPTP